MIKSPCYSRSYNKTKSAKFLFTPNTTKIDSNTKT